ncbi:hypothetical protein JCM11641_000907 [Rhodosporidiobolus odoratus]
MSDSDPAIPGAVESAPLEQDEDEKPKQLKAACTRCRAIKVRPLPFSPFFRHAPFDALALLAATANPNPLDTLPSFPQPLLRRTSLPQASLPQSSGLRSALSQHSTPQTSIAGASLPQPIQAPISLPPLVAQCQQSYPFPPSSILASTRRVSGFSPAPTASSHSPFADTPRSIPSPRPSLPSLSLLECAQAKETALANLANLASNSQAAMRPTNKPSVEPTLREADPIDMHILSEIEAAQLFTFYHTELNGFVILLDPFFHTVQHVRRTSTVLFASVVAVAAKFIRKDLYPSLLATAKQLIARGIVDGKASLGLIQSIFITVFYKEAEDNTAWLRIGIAIRMALQLHLHAERTTLLPADEHEARLIIDRERTWLVCIAFDHTYPLQLWDEDDGYHQLNASRQTCMIPQYRMNFEKWVEETRPYGVTDDLEQSANLEWIKVQRLSKDIARARPAHARALAAHLEAVLEATSQRYLENNGTPLNPRSTRRVTFFLASASVQLNRAVLAAVGFEGKGVTLAKFMVASSAFVDAFEELASAGMVAYWQDTLGVTMFSFGEFLVKLFRAVYPSNQTSMLEWMERIYRACESASGGDKSSTAAFISRFFQLAIRVVCTPSAASAADSTGGPASSASHATASSTAAASGAAILPPPPALAQAAGSSLPAAADVPVSSTLPLPTPAALDPLSTLSFGNSMGEDANYWESLFPGQATDWSWLDAPLDDLRQ